MPRFEVVPSALSAESQRLASHAPVVIPGDIPSEHLDELLQLMHERKLI
jgi:hypothetical protein